MRRKLLKVLVCPKCQAELECTATEGSDDGDICTGMLLCQRCKGSYPILRGIPRFVSDEQHASSFGYQWNQFRSLQIDSLNGTRLSEKRFYSETGWHDDWLKGAWVIDAGCGAGRFLEVVSRTDCEAVGVDISSAIDAAAQILAGRPNVHLVQASLEELPFAAGVFDACYCIGVIQHTPAPRRALKSLPRLLKPNGLFAVTIYERRRWTLLHMKYLIRPITKRFKQTTLLSLIKGSMPVLFPITEICYRLPLVGRFFAFIIPVANYVHEPELHLQQRYQWAVLDTFDMLSPQYDQPQKRNQVIADLEREGIVDIKEPRTGGLNIIGRKAAGPA